MWTQREQRSFLLIVNISYNYKARVPNLGPHSQTFVRYFDYLTRIVTNQRNNQCNLRYVRESCPWAARRSYISRMSGGIPGGARKLYNKQKTFGQTTPKRGILLEP